MGVYIHGLNLSDVEYIELELWNDGTVKYSTWSLDQDGFDIEVLHEEKVTEIKAPHGPLADLNEMLVNESEAYMSAQLKTKDREMRLINEAVHLKIQRLIIDTPFIIDGEVGDNG